MSAQKKRCEWVKRRRSADAGISRPRMGRAGPRRPQAFRVPGARRRPGGAQLVDDPQAARRLSAAFSEFDPAKGRPLQARRRSKSCSRTRRSSATARRSRQRSATRSISSPSRTSSAASTLIAGASSTAARGESRAKHEGHSRRPRRNPTPSARTLKRAASASSARPSSMPTCRRSGWSTTIWSTASAIARSSGSTSLAAGERRR